MSSPGSFLGSALVRGAQGVLADEPFRGEEVTGEEQSGSVPWWVWQAVLVLSLWVEIRAVA